MPYVHAWEKNGVYRRFYGDLTASELLDSNQKLAADVRFDRLNYDLSDYSQVRRHDITPEALDRWVLHALKLGDTNSRLLIAMVSGDEEVLRVLRDFKDRCGPQYPVQMFARVAEAREWLVSRGDARAVGSAAIGTSSVSKDL